ncbi:hypothetical protein [Paenibacillus sp. BIHB 4019]|nr:hypothetical protein [Paenibacillus sp. BIHB 4019]
MQLGEIQYANVFQDLSLAGYSSYMGLEYVPSLDIAKGLEYAKQLLGRS